MSEPRPTDSSYKARLAQVLRRRDPAALHLFLRQSAAGYGDERQVADVEQRSQLEMTELLHRMTLARPDLADLHAESRAWLAAQAGLNPSTDRPTRPGRAARERRS
jgi:hypothetical protein